MPYQPQLDAGAKLFFRESVKTGYGRWFSMKKGYRSRFSMKNGYGRWHSMKNDYGGSAAKRADECPIYAFG
jgi:hypothetical protein